MSAYLAVVQARFRTLLQYRGAALGGVIAQVSFGFSRAMILEGFYRSSSKAPSLTFAQAVGYIWLGQAFLALYPWNTDPEIREDVRTGTVVYQLCRPLDLYFLWYARALAWRVAPTLLRAVPMFLLAGLAIPALGLGDLGLGPPAGVAAALAWLAATAGAVLLSAALSTLLHATVLWSLGTDGVPAFMMALATLLGGLIIPLPLFPEWAQTLLAASPFAGTLDLPARLYVGHLPASALPWVLALQLGWTAALVVAGRWLLGRLARRLVIQGG